MEPVKDMSPHSRQEARGHRLLDAASDLLLRWGYKRITIDDVARQAGVGIGTVYLHWKTKEALFESVLLREAVAVWRELLKRVRADPEEVLLHRVMSSLLLVTRQRPLARALFTRDADLLGKLVQGPGMVQAQQMVPAQGFLILLRELGLLRTDMSLAAQIYAFTATVMGFSFVDPFIEDEGALSLEEKAEAMAQTIRRAFEPDIVPSLVILRDQVAPQLIQLLEQVCTSCEQQIQERMVS